MLPSSDTRELTLASLASLSAQTSAPHQTIVVDNASTDGSAAAIRQAFPDAELGAEAVNHGFACANNLAITRAKGRYVLLLTPARCSLGRGTAISWAERSTNLSSHDGLSYPSPCSEPVVAGYPLSGTANG